VVVKHWNLAFCSQYECSRGAEALWEECWVAHQGCPVLHSAAATGAQADEAMWGVARRHQT